MFFEEYQKIYKKSLPYNIYRQGFATNEMLTL
jgi:hypothetical protein